MHISAYTAAPLSKACSMFRFVIDRHDLDDVVKIIKKYNPHAFYSVDDVKFVSKKIYAYKKSWYKMHRPQFIVVITYTRQMLEFILLI